jgi:hypothetical protein
MLSVNAVGNGTQVTHGRPRQTVQWNMPSAAAMLPVLVTGYPAVSTRIVSPTTGFFNIFLPLSFCCRDRNYSSFSKSVYQYWNLFFRCGIRYRENVLGLRETAPFNRRLPAHT